ncbi:hypothetical protein BU17DRAFT_92967 [Hysterangium stoloniferum]|nr:hypothetical protein BU17DRAFT_92967 [Hysterangium stoloniferum]
MSTRVEKGNTKFRPVIKQKTRPSATPAPQDARGRQSVEPAASMLPPSIVPERDLSVIPQVQVPNVVTTTSVPTVAAAPGRATSSNPTLIQISRATHRLGNEITIPGSRAFTQLVQTAPTRASQPPQISLEPVASYSGSPTVTVPILMPSREASALPIPEPGSSRGTPIFVSRLTTTPTPASKGKKRAEPEPEPPSADNTNATEHGRVALKRPKLSILQAEADRVKKKPPHRAKSKKIVDVDAEAEGDTTSREMSETESVQKKRRATRKNKPTADGERPSAIEVQPTRPRGKRKAREKETHAIDTSDNAELSDAMSESSPPKKRRRRASTMEGKEPLGTPEPIDPTQTTMGAICDDLGSGRMSSRWESSQLLYAEARKRAREERARAVAEAEELERETGRATGKRGAAKPVLPGEQTSNIEGDEETVENAGQDPDEFSYTESLKASHYAPQVRIGANGEVVLDMDSLQVDRAADPEFVEEYNHIEENDQSRYTNSNSWSKRRVVRWGKEDTALFYDALRQFGQNFDLIARVIPGRTYRMCKNKFKAEDKKNPALIDEALKNGVAVDLSTLSRMTGKDFTGPTPVIEARKALTFAEDEAAPQSTQENNATEQTEVVPITEANVPVSLLENADNPAIHTSQPITRHSASPPPPEALLNNTPTLSVSSFLPEVSLIADGSEGAATTVRAVLGPITIEPPRRTIGVPLGKVSQKPIQAKLPTVSNSSSPAVASTSKKSSPIKKREKKSLQEEGVEVLGLVNDHIEE